MKTLELYEKYDVHGWLKYNPHEGHYAKFNPNVITTGFKIFETYNTFCNARTLLYSSEVSNLGDLTANDDLSVKYTKSTFLQSSLATYNYCIDLSWQVAWFYCSPDDYYGFIDSEKKYTDYSKACTYDVLILKLRLGNKKKIMELLHEFYSNKTVRKIRSEYNYMKHRGGYYTPGLGEQRPVMFGTINGNHFNMIQRNIFDIEEWIDILFEIDRLFYQFFNTFIDSIMPKNYLETTLDFMSPLDYYSKRKRNNSLSV
ncbi:hypothetical protein [Paenibacillus sp. FSL K6-1558]|uniref:hypothetical protein n=1 Tax=Paenibacillus sp. FSL K6-1558 TaxID=2921473 RepID=UPI0030FCD567